MRSTGRLFPRSQRSSRTRLLEQGMRAPSSKHHRQLHARGIFAQPDAESLLVSTRPHNRAAVSCASSPSVSSFRLLLSTGTQWTVLSDFERAQTLSTGAHSRSTAHAAARTPRLIGRTNARFIGHLDRWGRLLTQLERHCEKGERCTRGMSSVSAAGRPGSSASTLRHRTPARSSACAGRHPW